MCVTSRKGRKNKLIFIYCVVCTKKDITLYIIVSLLIYVRIKRHVDVALLVQCDWILDRSLKHIVRRLNCFRCRNWYVCIHPVCCLVWRWHIQCGEDICNVEFAIYISLVTRSLHFWDKGAIFFMAFFLPT